MPDEYKTLIIGPVEEPEKGDPGRDGVDGVDGKDGRDGLDGKDGTVGARGAQGDRGPEGLAGKDGERGPRGLPGTDGRDGKDGIDGKDGAKGEPGADGKDGASAYEIWLQANPGKSKRDYLASMKASLGVRSTAIGSGGGGLAAVRKLREELEGVGHVHEPKSATLTRDGLGQVETVTVEGEDTWTLSRNPNQSVASLTDGTYDVAVDRDGNGVVTGITVT